MFFQDFKLAVSKAEKKHKVVLKLIKNNQLKHNKIDNYKDVHPIQDDIVYVLMVPDCTQYPEMMRLFKLSLLIKPSNSNVERGYSILNLIYMKQRKRLAESLNR